jgi:CRP-like cAMP-binding protein
MAGYVSQVALQMVLEQRCERLRKPNQTVLFHRGEQAFGLFIMLSGVVNLDFGVDAVFARSYGRGALIGLPATLTRRPYSMTATVTHDAEVGFLAPEVLNELLRERPEFCQPLLLLFGERMAENDAVQKAFLSRDKQLAQTAIIV